ncbi:hypothetical protein SCHPADRAFT_712509 [Schizopora paradoxa]|uniref:F-box domain-containing protein n=1 Tax=Schizopora paradoxa TaxID=27342 RepID=A0A0H2RLR2_9AGAM|nr:hypothetical protein SCHPADRAFT_712509 [Schizopora paradoxa]
MVVQDSSMISIADLPPDVLYRIVEVSLPSALPKPISSRADAIKFFSSTPPYSFAFTCRAWQNTVLSSHSLWSSIFLSFDLPDSADINALRRRINRHLDRAGKTPLTISLRLSSKYNHCFDSYNIIAFLRTRRPTLKRVALYVGEPINSMIALGIKDLHLLEELHIGCSISIAIEKSTLPTLKRLELEGPTSSFTMCWLRISPNLQELSFINIPPSYVRPWDSRNGSDANLFPFLRTLRVTRGNEAGPSVPVVMSMSFSGCVLNSITSDALTVLDIYLYSLDSHQALLDFLRRSMPPLEVLGLDVHFITPGDEADREWLVVHAFSCVPSVRELRYRGDLDVTVCPGVVMRILSSRLKHEGTSSLQFLPELEHLQLTNVVASAHSFISIVNTRRQQENRALKMVSLLGCFAKPQGALTSEVREELGTFEPGDDASQLPAALSALREFVSEGLELRVERSISDDNGV